MPVFTFPREFLLLLRSPPQSGTKVGTAQDSALLQSYSALVTFCPLLTQFAKWKHAFSYVLNFKNIYSLVSQADLTMTGSVKS